MRNVLILISLAVILSGCDGWQANPTETGDPRLVPFASADEMKQYLADQAKNTSRAPGGFWLPLLPGGVMAAEDTAANGQPAPGADYSTTNVQEAGVDESDRVKTDGQYLYVAAGDRLHVVRADDPAQMEEVAILQLDSYPEGLYLRGDRLVALSARGYHYDEGGPVFRAALDVPQVPYAEQTTVTVVSVADPSAPTIESTVSFEADLVTSRMIDDRLHLVLVTYPNLPSPVENIPSTPLDDMIPDATIRVGTSVVRDGNLAEWSDSLHPVDADGYGMTIVASLDITDPAGTAESTAIVADAGAIYASTEALYVTDTDFTFWSQLRSTTDIYKFDLTGGVAAYAGSGSVPGRVLNQFSMGEHEGYLRIATTDEGTFGPGGQQTPPSSGVYVLGPAGDGLQVVGKVEGIAPNETIHSARFIGPRGFLVTFEQIDPFFTLDLSNPAEPKVVGELKIPGFSEYLHMLDDDHLLAIGKDAEDVGDFSWFQGVQLSLFDVTVFDKPTLQSKQVLGSRGTESEALWNHKAFNHYPPLEAVAIPVDLYEGGTGGPDYGEHTFSGVYVFHVTPADGISLLGRVPVDMQTYYYGMGWCRTVFIGDNLYAVNDEGVVAVPFDELDADPWSLDFD